MFTPIKPSILNSVTELYLGFYGRAPDAGGLLFWSKQLESGTSVIEVANQFSKSIEFSRQYDGLSAPQKVSQIYDYVLDRTPDAEGLAFWANALTHGTSISQVVWSVVDSAFSQIGTADGLLVQNKVYTAQSLVAPIVNQQAISAWSVKTGFGEINVAASLTSVLGASTQTVDPVKFPLNQWALNNAHFQDAWAMGYTGKGVVIANIDSGLDLKNAALTHNLSTHNWNFITNTANVQDDNGHGTATASEMIARGALTGAAYDAQLMVLKVVDANGNGTQENLASAIRYAVDHGANVINVPLGGLQASALVYGALEYADSRNVVVCLAAGNGANSTPQYPAKYAQQLTNCITIGASALNADGSSLSLLASSNQAGSSVPYHFVEAPGSKILAYGLDNQIKSWTGTSFAAPLVAAQAAILLSASTGLGDSEIALAISHTAGELVGQFSQLA